MRTLINNFFYAVGFVLIAFLYSSNPDEIQIRDIARLVQSNTAQQLTFLLTLVLTGLEFMFGFTFTRSQRSASVGYAVSKSDPFAKALAVESSKEGAALKW